MKKFDQAPLWDSILESEIFKKIDINSFKNEGANSRITQYSSKTHGILFLKNLIFQMADTLGRSNLSILENIPNRQVGGGLTLTYDNITFDLDYLLAVEEIIFLKEYLKDIRSILEIGAGYGRTCHAILSIFPNIQEYNIIDLPSMLNLSQAYLEKVSIKDNFHKIKFNPISNLENIKCDLAINIDSMQEMSLKTVEAYLSFIDKNGKMFYSKNTVGKFDPSIFGWEKTENTELAMKSGILKNLINIFCPHELKKAQKQFISSFLPSDKWVVKKQAKTLPWSHYYQALYIKNA